MLLPNTVYRGEPLTCGDRRALKSDQMSFIDTQIGTVLDALQKSPFADRTMVVLVSDHGYHLGERGWWNKNTLFELSCRSPMIVYTPGMQTEGTVCDRLVEFVDIYLTITELCRVAPSKGLEGRSFAPLLQDPTLPWKEAAYTQLTRGEVEGRSVRTDRWHYIEWDEGRKVVELYDHTVDPGEYKNVATVPENRSVVERHKGLLRKS
jgi:iduronate 2-sulfatase